MSTLVEHLQEYLTRADVMERMKPANAACDRMRQSLSQLFTSIGLVIQRVAESPPSPGYEPMLVGYGVDPILARMMACILVRRGRRLAKESKRRRPVFDAIRFLASRGRQRSAIFLRAKLLLAAWEATSIIETIFDAAGVSESEFISLLKSVVERKKVDCGRIMEIAAAVAPQLSLARGPKVSAPSAAHEFLLEQFGGLFKGRRANSRHARAQEYAHPFTQATRREFDCPYFDNRPARRRLNGRALKTV